MPIGSQFAVFPDMYFYPIYRVDSPSGSFTRIGSLPESCLRRGVRTTPYLYDQARTIFSRRPGDVIVVGPRCVGTAGESIRADGR